MTPRPPKQQVSMRTCAEMDAQGVEYEPCTRSACVYANHCLARQDPEDPFNKTRKASAAMKEEIQQAVSRGWCHPGTSSKEMDVDLALAIAEEVEPLVNQPRLGLATTRQLLNELTSRIEVDYHVGGGGLDYTTVGGRP